MPTPTDTLRAEHVLILEALDLLETAARRRDGEAVLPQSWWQGIVSWLRDFADRVHHAKEENGLFPAMEKAGVPSAGGPVGVMLHEHVQGRALIATMADGDPAGRAVAARSYVALLRAHIDKENGILFPLADAVIDPPAMAALRADFDRTQAELGTAATLDHAATTLASLKANM